MQERNYYENFNELILFNWRRCHEDGEHQYARVNVEEVDERKCNPEKDEEAWDNIYQTYIDEFGWGSFFERVMELKEEIALLQCDMIIEDNRFLLNKIKALQSELDGILKERGGGDMDTTLIHLSKWMGYRIDDA